MNKLLNIVWAACLVHSACAVSVTPEIVGTREIPAARALCLKEYGETYGKGRTAGRELRISSELLYPADVRKSPFARGKQEFSEPVYIHIIISRLPAGAVGGAAHYLVSPESGKIIDRYHER